LVTEYIKINYARAENFRNLLNGFDTGSFGSCGISKTSGGSSTGGGQAGQGIGQGQGQGQGIGQNLTGADGVTIDERRILSLRGSAVVDARTNTLIVRDTAKKLEDAKKLIHRLDVPVRQVMIESRIVIASNTFARELGVRFGVAKNASVGSGKVFGLGGSGTRGNMGTQETSFTINDGVKTVTSSGTPAGVEINDMLVDLATNGTPYGALGMTLARGADYVLNLELQALQDEGKGEILSNPRVMTTDRCQATIKQGTQFPFQTSSGNLGTNIEFKEATLTLDVTPQITPSGSIIMDLEINKDALGAQAVNGNREIDTREVKTNVRVNDGETIVLGGIYEATSGNTINKVPFFGDLPGIGFLFKKTINQDDKSHMRAVLFQKNVRN